MKHAAYLSVTLIGASLEFLALMPKPSVSALPPHPSSKAISNVEMTPDYELSAAADAGKAKLEINASTMPAATSEQQDAAVTDVVSLPLNVTSEDFEQATAKQEQQESAMVAYCNRIRAACIPPLPPYKESAALTAAAQGHANVLARDTYSVYSRPGFAHDGHGDATPIERAIAAGFTGSLVMPSGTVGEIIGPSTSADYTGPYGVFQGWLNSYYHRQSLLCPTFDSCGFGVAPNQYGYVFVGVFGNSRTPHAQFISAAPAATAIPAARSAVSYTQPRACPGGVCGQVFYPQQPQQPRQYVQQPQQWQYQRPGLFGWRR